ncbi:hypothetical protein [Sulfurisphaera javensis]
MRKKKGLSEVVGFFIILIILLAVLIPLGIYLFSQPTVQAQQIQNAQAYKNLALEQYRDFQPIDFNSGGFSVAPVYFIYQDGSAYFVFVENQNPPEPLTITSIEVFNGTTWVTKSVNINVEIKYANTKLAGYPAIQIPLSKQPYKNQASYVAAVTQYGNIIYASPPYVLPMPSLKKSIGIPAVDPYNFTVLEQPQFEILKISQNGIPIQQFIHDVNGPNSNTMTFVWAYLLSKQSNGIFTFNGYWNGPIAYEYNSSSSLSLSSPPPPQFKGTLSGVFVGANMTLEGTFSGSLGSNSGYPIYFVSGNAESITFTYSFLLGSVSGESFSGEILLPGSILNNYFVNPDYLNITISGSGTIQVYNVSGSITINGSFNGYVNGIKEIKKSENGNQITITGNNITGIIEGTILSATLTPSYNTQGYLDGYINGILNKVKITANGVYDLLGYLIAAPIISAKLNNAEFNNVIANSVLPNVLAFPLPFNVTINEFSGILVLSNNHGSGTFNGLITFPPIGSLEIYQVGISDFSGKINGEFENDYRYLLGAWVPPVTLTVLPGTKNAVVEAAYSGLLSNYYWIVTPLVVRISVAIGNPSNETLVFTSAQITMKTDEIIQFLGSSGVQPFSATLYGSALDNFSKPIIVTPLNVSNFTLTLTIPVNSIFAPNLFPPSTSIQNQYQALESNSVDYIELYLTLLEPNGYGITITTIIPPYSIPVQGQAS